MLRNTLLSLNNSQEAIPLLKEILGETSLKIISSTIDVAKNAVQICYENKIPLSSTYKKIGKLQREGLVSIEKIDIDNNGRKVIYYRSNIKSVDFNLNKGSILLRLEQNDLVGIKF